MLRTAPPLAPSPDEARRELRRELLDPQYYDQDLLSRALDWIARRIDGTVAGAAALPALSWLAVTLIVVALLAALVLLASRARLTARHRTEAGGVLTTDQASAAQLRERAERALREGRHGDAVVDAFRALAVQQVELGLLDHTPGSTAREVALVLAEQHPGQRAVLVDSARLFDEVLYGERPATHEQAASVLDVDARLRSLR